MANRLRLADLLAGLSMVADMGYGLPVGQAMRSCLIGVALGRRLNLSEAEVADTFYASLLVHVGCVGFAHEMATVFGDEIVANRAGARTNFADPKDVLTTLVRETTRGMGPAARVKATTFIAVRGRALGRRYDTTVCEVGRETAKRIKLPGGVQGALYEVKEWWNGGGNPRGLKGDEIVLPARIAKVAADAAFFSHLGGTRFALDALGHRAGGMLDPSLVAELAASPALISEAAAGDPRQRILESEPTPFAERAPAELVDLASAFGDLVDLKTPFTTGHSKEVARLAMAAADTLGLDNETARRVQIAAHLNDIGRVGVSNAVWEKAERLTSTDLEQVRLHAYHAERILASSPLLEPMARLAGMHHERLDGSGYHRGCPARELPTSVRVLGAADAFAAMTEARPHRPALSAGQAVEEIQREALAGRLDAEAVAAVIDAAGHPRKPASRDRGPAGLSAREIEVLRLVAEGCSNPQIAIRLYISRRTAEHHVQHVYTKIGVSSRAAAALFAVEHGLIYPAS